MSRPFANFYRGKKVLLTGHTGFKGAWLALWLHHLGARVIGIALDAPSHQPSIFRAAGVSQLTEDHRIDVRERDAVAAVFAKHEPELVFHLAAQPLVRLSYEMPLETFETNVTGTLHVLEAARRTPAVRSVIAITTDKVYRNEGWEWGYRENDPLGGHDPYSASKACAELIVGVYQREGFQQSTTPPCHFGLASARAGNVVGGGDWSLDRIVPDTVRAIVDGRDVILRHPDATRPWQHVLEALSGYLWLGVCLSRDRARFASGWNFGPSELVMRPVKDVAACILKHWKPAPSSKMVIQRADGKPEAMALRLDSSKAACHLNWLPVWDVEQCLQATAEWYARYYAEPNADQSTQCRRQIEEYTARAQQKGILWACS